MISEHGARWQNFSQSGPYILSLVIWSKVNWSNII